MPRGQSELVSTRTLFYSSDESPRSHWPASCVTRTVHAVSKFGGEGCRHCWAQQPRDGDGAGCSPSLGSASPRRLPRPTVVPEEVDQQVRVPWERATGLRQPLRKSHWASC